MELRVLKYFLAIAREENISKAAESLHVTQPTLSRQIKELEDELNTQLFIRGSRNITLTSDGILLRKRAEEIISLADKAESEFSNNNKNITGSINIGGGETDAMKIIAKVASKMRSNYPNVHFFMYSGNAEDVSERLDRGLLDFGIMIEPADIKKYDYMKLPATNTWGLLMPKDDPLSKKKHILPKDLEKLPLFCSRQKLVQNAMSGWYGKPFESLNIIGTYNLLYNASLMVEEKVGYALCLDKLINTTGNSKLCFRPLYPKIEVGLVLVWKKYQIFSRAAEEFLKKLQDK